MQSQYKKISVERQCMYSLCQTENKPNQCNDIQFYLVCHHFSSSLNIGLISGTQIIPTSLTLRDLCGWAGIIPTCFNFCGILLSRLPIKLQLNLSINLLHD